MSTPVNPPCPTIVTPALSRSPASLSVCNEGSGTPGQARGDGNEDGFTLVELMVVIVIIALLSAIVAYNVFPSVDKARATTAKTDIHNIDAALELYKLQMTNYPTTDQGLEALVRAPAGVNAADYQPGGYIKGSKVPVDPWGKPYRYRSPGQHGDVDIWSLGRDGKEGGTGPDADITSW